MNRLAWIAIVALAGITTFVVGDLLDPESVPVAQAVELSGTAPGESPPLEGFFIVPPRVVDFRNDPEDRDDRSDPSESAESTNDGSGNHDIDERKPDDDLDDDVSDDDDLDVSPADSADDSDDGDDSVDDDD